MEPPAGPDAERARLAAADRSEQPRPPWRRWGPYLSERAWGTVREDYSADGDAWSYLPFEHAHSRAYRWSEDGLAGVCDAEQRLCLALGLWNGRDAVIKERPYGLTGEQGNHGEDVKDYWWYLDATPTSSYLLWRYHYPQAAFPYDDLRTTNGGRPRTEPEYELADTGVFADGRYWAVTVTWAKAGPEDLCWQVEVENNGRDSATLDVLPTIWFRNVWSWDSSTPPQLRRDPDGCRVVADHPELGSFELVGAPSGEALVCDNETNVTKLYGIPGPAYPKDGIADHVMRGVPTVNPRGTGTKAALRYRLTVGPGETATVRLRFRPVGAAPAAADLGSGFAATIADRKAEADAFYAPLCPTGTSDEARRVHRQASAGMLWSKQYFHYNVERWLAGDPAQPPPPPARRSGRNAEWFHVDCRDIISMPDPWEYPWFAAWDLAFHCVALAHLDAEFAKRQLILLGREWYMHPNGQLPAYEWNFGDVNPPVQAWAALRVWEIDRRARQAADPSADGDDEFLERMFHKLLLNFTWWVNRKDASGSNVFEGGFLGLDNIGLFDRSKPLPVAGRLEQSDGTAWMAMYCLNLLEMALQLAVRKPAYEDVATKFFEHFTYIASAMETQGLWDDDDGFFYDVIALDDGGRLPVKVRSMVGVVALFAVTVLPADIEERLPAFARRVEWFEANKPAYARHVAHIHVPGHDDCRLLSIVDGERLRRVLAQCLDPAELLSEHGLRSLSRRHADRPFTLDLGGVTASIDYEPAESTNYLFGGNSNWRGPVWFPLNYLLIEALRRYERYFGPDFTVEHPTGSGRRLGLGGVATALAERLVAIFLPGPDGRRPVHGTDDLIGTDPGWRDLVWFHEYFHADTGAGLGASHQTGWTGLVLDLIARP